MKVIYCKICLNAIHVTFYQYLCFLQCSLGYSCIVVIQPIARNTIKRSVHSFIQSSATLTLVLRFLSIVTHCLQVPCILRFERTQSCWMITNTTRLIIGLGCKRKLFFSGSIAACLHYMPLRFVGPMPCTENGNEFSLPVPSEMTFNAGV